MDMDMFVLAQNIEKYRMLARAATDEAERNILLGLLAEEAIKWLELYKAYSPLAPRRRGLTFKADRRHSAAPP